MSLPLALGAVLHPNLASYRHRECEALRGTQAWAELGPSAQVAFVGFWGGTVASMGPLLQFAPDSGWHPSSKASSKGNKLNLSKYQRVIM